MEKPEKEHRLSAHYSLLLNDIRERILSGDLAAGERLPTESEIAKQHHVSRGTVRQALSVLAKEGLVARIQGSGTYVHQQPAATQAQEAITAVSAPRSIGIILNESNDELGMSILRGIEQTARTRGYHLSFAYAEEDLQILAQSITRLQASTAGLVISPVSEMAYDGTIARLADEHFPFVLVDHYLSDLDCDYVVSDNTAGGYRATEHLLILGHTRIGFAYAPGGGLRTTSVRDRWEGYRQALLEYNIPYDEALLFHNVSSEKRSEDRLLYDEILLSANRPGAIFAATDAIALGFVQAAQRLALRIPEDLALVGFDDLSFAAHLSCPLTTIAQQGTEMGIRAGTLLINRIERQISDTPKHIEVPTQLMIRQSCGARLRVSGIKAREKA